MVDRHDQRERRLTIVGASARAAAVSAYQAGFVVTAADLFSDQDLKAVARAWRIPAGDYPAAIVDFIQSRAAPWMYTGGLENHPGLIDLAAAKQPLYGNAGPSLLLAKDMAAVTRAAESAGWTVPEMSNVPLHSSSNRDEPNWVRKPIRSCGGWGVRWHVPGDRSVEAEDYVQRFIQGPTYSGAYLATEQQTILLGVTRQFTAREIVGCDKAVESPFAYVGSVGPLENPEPDTIAWEELGVALASRFSLRGLFGVDAIVDSARKRYVLDVNPRFTASMELFDVAVRESTPAADTTASVVGWHVEACRGRQLAVAAQTLKFTVCCGKAVSFASRDTVVDQAWLERLNHLADETEIELADVPCSPSHIRRRQPLLTCLARGGTPEVVQRRLGLVGADGFLQVCARRSE